MAPSAQAEPRVRARVSWRGECQDDEALKREAGVRGVELETRAEPVQESAFWLTVEVERGGAASWSAVLRLSAANGALQERSVEAKSCQELQSVVAWILIALAREGTGLSQPGPSSVAFPGLSEGTADPGPTPISIGPVSAVSATPHDDATDNRRARRFRGAERASLRLGTSFVSGFGLLPSVAVGPQVYAEYISPSRSVPALRVSLIELRSLPYERGAVTLRVERLSGRLGASWNAGWRPLSLGIGLGLELGRLSGAGVGPSLARAGTDTALWFATELSPVMRWPLLGKVLEAEIGAALAYSPQAYSLQFGDGQPLSRTEKFEGRLFAGLAARL